jgi:hypothetical protein
MMLEGKKKSKTNDSRQANHLNIKQYDRLSDRMTNLFFLSFSLSPLFIFHILLPIDDVHPFIADTHEQSAIFFSLMH